MKTAAGSGHKRGDLPPPGPVLHKLGPDFQLLAVEDHVGLITQGKPEVGVIKEVHFFEQSGGRTKIPTSETGTVHYYVHVLNGRNILANSKTVYKLPADKRGAEDLAGNLEAKRQKLHHFHHVIIGCRQTIRLRPYVRRLPASERPVAEANASKSHIRCRALRSQQRRVQSQQLEWHKFP
jgi:hypothetical protein